ncbi:MAG: tetratricopeptide repeat protein [Bacteroidetes bacterium]|jgi:signal transduction histidine kinase|nr:tetratricopeptide repeat protein [Bacteroidota bacterium]
MKKVVFVLMSLFLSQLTWGKTNVDSLIAVMDKSAGEEKVDILLKIGQYYCQNQTKKAIGYTNQALALSKEIDYNNGEFGAYNTLAITYERMHEYEEALKNYQMALALAEQVEDINARARIFNNIGNAYDLLEEHDKATKNYYLGLENLDTTETQLHVMLHLNLGAAYGDVNQYDSTLLYFKRALEIARQPGFENDNLLLLLMANLAELYSLIGDKSEALNKASEAKDMLSQELNNYTHAAVMHIYAGINLKYKKYKEAEKALYQVIELADELNNNNFKITALERMAILHKEQGRYEEAIGFYEVYIQVKDSNISVEKNKRIAELEAKYEAERKQNEIDQLKKEKALNDLAISKLRVRNTLFVGVVIITVVIIFFIFRGYRLKKRTNKKLTKMNAALKNTKYDLEKSIILKDNLIKVIGHDLRGPIGSISGFAQLLATGKWDKEPEPIKKYSKLIYQISDSALTLLTNILYWAKLQQGEYSAEKQIFNSLEVTQLAIQPYMGIANDKKISVQLNINNAAVAYGDKFAFSIIMGNLVNNALKFTPKGGVIRIMQVQQNNGVTFSVADTGIGLEKDIANALFSDSQFISSKGTENETGTGFGLKICKKFVDINNGKIWYENNPDFGATFFFHFPYQKKS